MEMDVSAYVSARPRIATTDAEIAACFPVMHELRPHLEERAFVARIRVQQSQGYELAYIEEQGEPLATAGFRIGENLAWGRFLYVDDLVTTAEHRSKGYGALLLRWLCDLAKERGCSELHLDSGVQRTDAHRFYEREGMELSSFHYKVALGPSTNERKEG